jgi:cytochrome c oxidase subunit 2
MDTVFFPPEASAEARSVDVLFFGLTAISAAIVALVVALCLAFAIRYRRSSNRLRRETSEGRAREVEIGWTAATFFTFLFIFWWAAVGALTVLAAPERAVEIHVVAKQWMWKTQHSNGASEINELHAPVGVPVRLVMTSQDVIHSFFLPALRLKQDVLPGRYTEAWFKADKAGTFNLLCAEFCGTDHSKMGGRIVLMKPADYQAWLAKAPHTTDFAAEGRSLFTQLGCSGCHGSEDHTKAPNLAGLSGRVVKLADGRSLKADDAYIRGSILEPHRDVVAGYEPIMPSYRGVVDDGQLSRIVAYIKTLDQGGAS